MSNKTDDDSNIEINESQIDALIEKAWNLRAVDPLQGLELGERALSTAKDRDYQPGLAKSLSILAACNYRLANYETARTQSMEALGHLNALSDKEGHADILNTIGNIHLGLSKYYQEAGDLTRALEHYQAFHTAQKKIFDDDLIDKTTKLQIVHQVETSKREADLRQAETEVLHLKNIELNAQSQELAIEVGESKQTQKELLRRNQQLAAAAEVARITTSTLDLVTLLTTSVEVIREKFNFYHASVFLVDHSTNMVILEGSTGEAGRQLKASHHQLAIGSNSLVGLATATRQPVVVQDVTNDPTHFKNPLLPDTHAEAVIPLLSGDVVVGALDVQSTFADAFSDSDVRLLITIADQLTVAIENARLYASAQKELAERKRAEQALQEIKDALEIRVRERTVELKDANEQLQVELIERKRIEAQLEQSLSTLQATIESTTDGILVVERDGKVASFNQRFIKMWHIPNTIIDSRKDEQLLAFVLDQLVDPDAFKAKVQELYSQPEVESFDVLVFKDGRIFERYSRPQQIAGQSVGRVWSFRDVTERKQAEDELRKSQESFERIVSTMKDVVYSVDAQTREFSYLGPAFEQLLGYSMEDIRKMGGRQAFLAQVITGGMFTKQEATFEHLLLGKTDVPNWEEWWRCKDGTLVCLEDRSMPVYEDGHLIGTQGILRDVTERKQAERRNIVYSQLGQRLSLVTKPQEAARIIVEAADELLGWDACTVDLLSPILNALSLVLSVDLINGKRVDVTTPKSNSGPSPMELLVLKEGPQLILRQSEDLRAKLQPFGDHNRPSASILYVPIRHGNNTTSFLSIQSYTPNAYDRNDLDTLQFLADYCAGALDRMWAEEARREAESKYRGLFENSVVGIYQTSVDGRFVSANAALARILGYDSPAELMEGVKDIAAKFYVDPDRRKEFKRIIDEHNVVNGFESEIYRKDGSILWVSEYGHGVRDHDGTLLYFEGVTEDITARKQAEAALQESEERYAVAMRGANDGLWDWNLRTKEMYYSPRWKSMLGCQEEEVGSSPDEWFKRIHPDDISQVRVELDSHLKGKTSYFESEHRMRHANGHYLWVLSRGLALRNEKNEAFRIAGSQTDMTIRKQAEERLEHDALHDGLTGLPNRTLFLDRLEHAIKKMKRSKEDSFAVLFLDIDRFKLVNDSLGHAIGDLLLIEIGDRLKICLRPGDTVARLGGDEFAIILDAIKSPADATHVANRIQEELTKPFNLDGHHFSTSASIGITLSKTSYNNAEDLLRDADTAMYRAKTTGKARHEIFDKDMHAEVSSLLQLEADLRKAIENDEFRVFYQPLISMTTHKVVGTEALVRWQHPQRGLLPPAAFITALEETGMILQVGEWVLRTACEQNKIWQNSGNSQLRVAVNFSARQFQIKNLTEMVRNVLEQTGMDPQTLELEITESTAIKDAELTLKTFEQLHELGVGISLDDFGSGYSALGYLSQYPFQSLKADRSFISDIPNDSNDMAITSAIIAMAHSLRLRVVAEGVETTQQLEFLRSNNCDEVQGFLFSRPVPAMEMTKLLLKKSLVPASKSKSKKQAQPATRSKPKIKKVKK